MLAPTEESKPPKDPQRKATAVEEVQTILSDPEIRAALRDIMAGLSEALDRIERLESERLPSTPKRVAREESGGADAVPT